MKALALAIAICGAAASQAGTLTFSVFISGEPAGTATYSQSLGKDGSLLQGLVMHLKINGADTYFATSQRFARNGMPLTESREEQSIGSSKTITVTYSPKGATVKTNISGAVSTKTFAAPPGSLVTPSVFWFLRTKPMRGAAETRLFFDVDKGAYFKKTTTYVGKTYVRLSGVMKAGHLVRQGNNIMIVDQRGQPLELTLVDGQTTIKLSRKLLAPGVKGK